MDGPTDSHTEFNMSEREKQISYTNSWMWNLEKWYRWSYLHTDIHRQQTYGHQNGGGGVEWTGKFGLTYVYYWYYA